MSRCRLQQDDHNWQVLTQVSSTAPTLRVIYVCACGVFKMMEHAELPQVHPDERFAGRAAALEEDA